MPRYSSPAASSLRLLNLVPALGAPRKCQSCTACAASTPRPAQPARAHPCRCSCRRCCTGCSWATSCAPAEQHKRAGRVRPVRLAASRRAPRTRLDLLLARALLPQDLAGVEVRRIVPAERTAERASALRRGMSCVARADALVEHLALAHGCGTARRCPGEGRGVRRHVSRAQGPCAAQRRGLFAPLPRLFVLCYLARHVAARHERRGGVCASARAGLASAGVA